jgi:hypothetical protein
MTTHAVLSASGASRWLSCPGSVRLSKGLKSTSSVYAEEGTAAHELAFWCLSTGNNTDHYLGKSIPAGDHLYEVTEEMAEAIQVYVDTVRADISVVGDAAEVLLEQKFQLDWLYPDLFGTNDALVGEFLGILRIYDLKYGKGVAVEVEDNSQLMYYGLGGSYGRGYEEVELVVVQPRASHEDGVVRRQRMTIDELTRWGQEVLLPGAKATEDPEAPLCLGEHCRFCPALAICPAQRDRALDVAKGAFDDIPSAPPPPETLSHAELRKIAGVAGMIEAWLNACWDHIKTMLETGAVTPEEIGYKIVEGRVNRAWTNAEEAEKWLLERVADGAYVPKKLVSPAQAEKLLKGPDKKEVADLISTTRGRQLAPISDKRPAIPPAISAFSEVPDEDPNF